MQDKKSVRVPRRNFVAAALDTLLAVAMALPAKPGLALSSIPGPFVRAPDVAAESFVARLAARPGAVSLAEYWDERSPEEAQSRQLSASFSRAQSLFLEGSSENAERAFRDVVRLARDADWRDAQRRALSFSFMRLAQLATAPGSVEERVEGAAAFAPDLRPDADAFPPPLVADWDKALARLKIKSTVIALDEKFAGYEALKIDGRAVAIRPGATALIAPGPHRFSALSSAYPYFSQVLTGAQLQALRIDQAPLASGDCAEPRFAGFAAIGAPAASVAFNECVKAFDGRDWVEGEKAAFAPSLGAIPAAETGGVGAPSWLKAEAPKVESPRHAWLWAAVTVMALAAVGYIAYRARPGQAESAAPPTEAIGL
jgi:hypothetical protein